MGLVLDKSKRFKGKGLEQLLEFVHMVYQNQNIAIVEKVEVSKIWNKTAGKMVYSKKAGFDYQGVICEDGRAIAIEAKESQDKLWIDPKGKSGLKVHQIEALIRYGRANAYAGVVWSCTSVNKIFFLDWKFLSEWMGEVYNKQKHRGKVIKSIMLDHVEGVCPMIDKKGCPDYLMKMESRK